MTFSVAEWCSRRLSFLSPRQRHSRESEGERERAREQERWRDRQSKRGGEGDSIALLVAPFILSLHTDVRVAASSVQYTGGNHRLNFLSTNLSTYIVENDPIEVDRSPETTLRVPHTHAELNASAKCPPAWPHAEASAHLVRQATSCAVPYGTTTGTGCVGRASSQ